VSADVEVRHLSMKVGRTAEQWAGNCIAVGLSQGFIEPLEATALLLVQFTVQSFIWSLETANFTDAKRDRFNHAVNSRFDAVRDYVMTHYLVNSRTDTDYWRANADNNKVSSSLYDIISIWTAGKDLTAELRRQKLEDYYPSTSWHCLLAGYGVYPAREGLHARDTELHQAKLNEIREFIRRCALNYAPHMEVLAAGAMSTRNQAAANFRQT